MNAYQQIAQSKSNFEQLLYDDEIFVTLATSNFNWLTEIGFLPYTPIEMKVFSRNPKYYKIEDDYIFFTLFRTQGEDTGKYDLCEKYKLIKSDELVIKLNNNEDIYDNFIQNFVPSNDLKKPSMIMYRSLQRDYIYYDDNMNKKKLSYCIDEDVIMLKIDSNTNFYISSLQFNNGQLVYIEVMIDGVIKSGEPLKSVWNELSVLTPTLEEFFNFEVDLTDEMKFLFEAVAI